MKIAATMDWLKNNGYLHRRLACTYLTERGTVTALLQLHI